VQEKWDLVMNLQEIPINLTLRQLRAFVAVATLRGFTAAGNQLHLSQSALSGLVKELEDGLGVRLLDRNTREVSLTQAGAEFLPLARRVLTDVHDAVAGMSDIKHQRRGIVRVAALELLSCTVLPKAIVAFQRTFPRIEVRLVDSVIEQVLAKVGSGEVDLGIGPEPARDPEIERTPFLTSPFQLVCRRDHRLAQRTRVTWSDLQGETFITMIRNFSTQIMSRRRGWPADLTIVPAYEVALLTTALGMTSAGLGVAVCPRYGLSLARGLDLAMLPLEEPVVNADLYVFTKKGRSLSPAARAFVAFLADFVRESGCGSVPAATLGPLSIGGRAGAGGRRSGKRQVALRET
jgi:DNA-binding transcriptional LysR family regulator